jgi:hypothetical protein
VYLGDDFFLRAIPLPSAAAFELAYTGKPPLRQGVPFLGDLIETSFASQTCH